MSEVYLPEGTCSTEIRFDVTDNIVRRVEFADGCEGSLRAIGKLVEGMTVEQVIALLKGMPCEARGTSCPDQLAQALEEWKKKKQR
jgi:uncharacterized protein (TIGR03905 family)